MDSGTAAGGLRSALLCARSTALQGRLDPGWPQPRSQRPFPCTSLLFVCFKDYSHPFLSLSERWRWRERAGRGVPWAGRSFFWNHTFWLLPRSDRPDLLADLVTTVKLRLGFSSLCSFLLLRFLMPPILLERGDT